MFDFVDFIGGLSMLVLLGFVILVMFFMWDSHQEHKHSIEECVKDGHKRYECKMKVL